MDGALLALLALLLLALGAYGLARWDRWRRSLRGRLAADGERSAEVLLASCGYAVLGCQVPGALTLWVDGEPRRYGLRADLLVERHGERLVAEVKTGHLVPRLSHGPTRRQLLEYQLAFGVRAVLLVDATRGTVREVRFAPEEPTP
ncbi:MAG: hypothetical protein HY909_16560 [Deltaproteobacteria bacterium]|nr:hypothetical protein [Deltaproteobacteria bacterium]